jgi:hypothetical protein
VLEVVSWDFVLETSSQLLYSKHQAGIQCLPRRGAENMGRIGASSSSSSLPANPPSSLLSSSKKSLSSAEEPVSSLRRGPFRKAPNSRGRCSDLLRPRLGRSKLASMVVQVNASDVYRRYRRDGEKTCRGAADGRE